MNPKSFISSITLISLLILLIPVLLLVTGIFKPDIFNNLSKIGDSIGGITSPIIGVLGIILVYFTFEQQRYLINTEIEKTQSKRNNIRGVIISDLLQRQYSELKDCKDEIEKFMIVKDNPLYRSFIFRETLSLNADFINSIPIQDLYESFENKSEFYKIIYIYKNIEFIKNYTLENLSKGWMTDYSDTITLDSILKKQGRILETIPKRIEDTCRLIRELASPKN